METNRSMAIEGQQQQQQAPQPQQTNWGNIGSGIAGTIADLVMGDRNASRQWKRAKEGMEIQMANQKELNKFNQELNLDTWNKTNYEAQRQHLEKAGLSVGMMYGGSGAGGAIMGNAGGSTGAPNAPNQQYTPVSQNIGMAMQLELLQAQKANIEADTAQKLATVPKTGAETENIGADTALKNLQAENQKILNNIANKTSNDIIETVEANRTKAEAEAGIALVQGRVMTTTEKEQIEKIRAEATNTALQGLLTKANIAYTEEDTRAISVKLAQEWEKLYQADRANDYTKMNAYTNAFNAKLSEYLGKADLQLRETIAKMNLGKDVANILSGKLPTTTTSTTQGDKGYQQTTTTHR